VLSNSVAIASHARHSISSAESDGLAGCSERPLISPTQPRRAKTRLSPGKAAASEEANRTLLGRLSL